MKKIICVILSLLLLFGLATATVFADDLDDHFYLAYHYFGTNNGYDICTIDALFTIMEYEEVIGGYLFMSPTLSAPETRLALYAVKGLSLIHISEPTRH